MIFDRQFQTRIVCIVAAISGLSAAVLVITLFGSLIVDPVWLGANLDWLFRAGAIVFAASAGSIALLWLWRKCDRCHRRLFEEGHRSLLGSGRHLGQSLASVKKQWWGRMALERERDYRAKTFLGSYRNAAILEMAMSGTVRCQWCGHVDGARLDYTVTDSK